MPPKAELTKEKLLHSALELVKERGADALSARALAERLHCSTQPIYRLYSSMEEMKIELYDRAVQEVLDGYGRRLDHYEGTDSPALVVGLAYLRMAQEERHLFEFVHLSAEHPIELGSPGSLKGENLLLHLLRKSNRLSRLEEDRLRGVLTRLTIYLTGLAVMICSGAIRITPEEQRQQIIDLYEILLAAELKPER